MYKSSAISLCLIFLSLFIVCFNKCAYKVDDNGWPIKLKDGENQPYLIQGMYNCKQYNGKMGCCDINNDKQQNGSYIQIDSVFGFAGSGCDHCAINLKRFWCQYACSPNQTDFVHVQDGYVPVPDPQKPGQNVTVQLVTLTVEAQTACDLYNSCKRNSFVSSVSAMQSPAGFLTFQGHNAVDEAFQYIQVNFTYDKTKGLSFSDEYQEIQRKQLTSCNTKVNGTTWHEFKFNENCKCNTCEQACDSNSGFIYSQSSVFQGFNWMLVGGTYLAFGIIAALITIKRSRKKEKSY